MKAVTLKEIRAQSPMCHHCSLYSLNYMCLCFPIIFAPTAESQVNWVLPQSWELQYGSPTLQELYC